MTIISQNNIAVNYENVVMIIPKKKSIYVQVVGREKPVFLGKYHLKEEFTEKLETLYEFLNMDLHGTFRM